MRLAPATLCFAVCALAAMAQGQAEDKKPDDSQQSTGRTVMPDDNKVVVIPADVSIQVLVPEDFGRALTASDFTATVSARKVDLTLPRVKVKPEVSLAHPLAPGIQVHEVIPPLVTLHKLEKS